MKKVLLTLTALVALAQAGDIVHYDTNDNGGKQIAKPNHPTTDLYR